MKKEEKILILGALFHDIGKFAQRCTNEKTKHEEIGYRFLTQFEDEFINILGDSDSFYKMREIVSTHHNRDSKNSLVKITQKADHISASERVEFDEPNADLKDKWSHKFLASLFSKIYLTNPEGKNLRYYGQKLLTRKDPKILIPEFYNEEEVKESDYVYNESTFNEFTDQLRSVFTFYNNDEDFSTLINLLLILFEKFLWSVPDFTGSEQTDISLFNHSKDVAGFSHAIYKSELANSNKLNLIIGDLPGIQKYIFNVANKKPAKVLRGRSIYVQILTRQFASIMLKEFGLTETNLIMLAGGKFYIIADNSGTFLFNYKNAIDKIDSYLIKNFNFQLSFSSAYESFEYNLLKEKDKTKRISFGDIIDSASYKLLNKRNKQFENELFETNNFNENRFVLDYSFISPESSLNSDKIKCSVTGLPIKNGRNEKLDDEPVDIQVKNEFLIGEKVTKSNVVIEFSPNYSEVLKVNNINDYKSDSNSAKIILNPNLEELLSKNNLQKDILRNSLIIEVANYATRDNQNHNLVMDFEEMEKFNSGAKFMTLIKGDVDNLGLIMSSGLVGNRDNGKINQKDNDLTGVSRTTTLSNHLKYFFSFSLNGFLANWEKGEIEKSVDDNYTDDQKVYTVFAGGDDLMLVCPQSSALKLLEAFNRTFNDFVCNNPEVHISYSLTNFKHNTPIRLVADMAEDNQDEVKSSLKSENILNLIEKNNEIFSAKHNKASFRLFETNLKNEDINKLIKDKQTLIQNVNDNNLTIGIIRDLLYFANMMKNFREQGDTQNLLWLPLFTYKINNKIKHKGLYKNKQLEDFFEAILKVNKNEKEIRDEVSLYSLANELIYSLRK